jgi:DHA2 family multidrug resistance protein
MTGTELEPQFTSKQLLAFVAIVIGMFMAILDIQIVASSLPKIGAGLSASGDELSWIQTSYLIAEVIIIPITGFLARLLSTRISYFIAALGFTVMSVLCATSWNLESMIVFRALQGFFGGAMIPTAFGAVFIIFPKSMHTKVSMIIGLVVTVAPTLGPSLGGYITEIISWHFMFLLNVIPGIFVCITVFLYVDFDKPNYKLLQNFDLLGILLMASTLGTLQYILEEGNRKDWFNDGIILALSIFVFVGFISLIIRELTFVNPIVDLGAFRNRNFTFGCLYSFTLGVGLYGAVYIMPLFLFSISGYNTLQIGLTMFVTGAFQFVSAPMAAKLVSSGIDKRIVLAIGYTTFGTGCYLNSFLTAEAAYWEFFIPQMVRGLALMFCFMPINDLALGTLNKSEVQNASGLYNLTRNLGGAIGLAVINNLINSKSKISISSMSDNISLTSPLVIEQLKSWTQMLFGKVDNPELAAFALLNDLVAREAFVIAINNIYVIISLVFFSSLLLLPFTATTQNITEASEGHGAH